MISVAEIGWVAGLLEGEGHFYIKQGVSSCIRLQMTDEDVVAKFRDIVGKQRKLASRIRKDGHKTVWTVDISGNDAIGWMMTIYSLMGRRRKEKIREIIFDWGKRVNRMSKGNIDLEIIKKVMKFRKISAKEAHDLLEKAKETIQ